ncbi:uncharacterized protein LOC117628927 [Prunus dulcis]|uniref:uncharacterized protein LOC117628927 n=1 Tax=Prunus dulcis TaxID=3755 RepID=UPI001482912F|nr:uncharacterized protein LOC117628927 [Prunus dulcis]
MAKVLPQLNFFIILVLLGSAMFTKAIVKENNANGVTSADPSCRKIIYGSYCPEPRGPLRLGKEDECSVRCSLAEPNSVSICEGRPPTPNEIYFCVCVLPC